MLTYELISPEKRLSQGQASMVTLPGAEGEFGVLPGHAPLVAALQAGTVKITNADNSTTEFAIGAGFADIANDRVLILAEAA